VIILKKKTWKYLKKLKPELLTVICTLMLLVSLFVITASAEDTQAPDKNNTDEKISSALATKIAETPATEKLKVIIVFISSIMILFV